MRGFIRDGQNNWHKVYRIAPNLEKIWVEDYDDSDKSIHGSFSAIPTESVDWDAVPPRQWIYGNQLLRGQVSVLTGGGGVGKTSYVTTAVSSLALGENLFDPGNLDPAFKLHLKGRQRVYVYGLEDDLTEAKRRFLAVLGHHGKSPEDLAGHLWLGDGTANRLVVAATDHKNGNIIQQAAVQALIEFLKEHKISVLVLDPLVKAHKVNENDNIAMDAVMVVLKEIAIEASCAIWLVHHSGKAGATMDVHGSRGASSIVSAARVSETLCRATIDERQRFEFKGNVVRLEPTKANLSATTDDAMRWFAITGRPIGNGNENYPDGDCAQVMTLLSTATPPIDSILFNAICEVVRKGPPNGRTSHWLNDRKHENDILYGFRLAGMTTAPGRLRRLQQMLSEGLIIPEEDTTGSQGRRLNSGLRLNEKRVEDYIIKHFSTQTASPEMRTQQERTSSHM